MVRRLTGKRGLNKYWAKRAKAKEAKLSLRQKEIIAEKQIARIIRKLLGQAGARKYTKRGMWKNIRSYWKR